MEAAKAAAPHGAQVPGALGDPRCRSVGPPSGLRTESRASARRAARVRGRSSGAAASGAPLPPGSTAPAATTVADGGLPKTIVAEPQPGMPSSSGGGGTSLVPARQNDHGALSQRRGCSADTSLGASRIPAAPSSKGLPPRLTPNHSLPPKAPSPSVLPSPPSVVPSAPPPKTPTAEERDKQQHHQQKPAQRPGGARERQKLRPTPLAPPGSVIAGVFIPGQATACAGGGGGSLPETLQGPVAPPGLFASASGAGADALIDEQVRSLLIPRLPPTAPLVRLSPGVYLCGRGPKALRVVAQLGPSHLGKRPLQLRVGGSSKYITPEQFVRNCRRAPPGLGGGFTLGTQNLEAGAAALRPQAIPRSAPSSAREHRRHASEPPRLGRFSAWAAAGGASFCGAPSGGAGGEKDMIGGSNNWSVLLDTTGDTDAHIANESTLLFEEEGFAW